MLAYPPVVVRCCIAWFIAWGCANSTVTNTQTINSDSGISINKVGIWGDWSGKLHSTCKGIMDRCFIVNCIQGSYWSNNAEITISAEYHSFFTMNKYQTFTISHVSWGKRYVVQPFKRQRISCESNDSGKNNILLYRVYYGSFFARASKLGEIAHWCRLCAGL